MKEKKQNAFSLIELLVVMSVMAILALGMWVLLNPMEQMKKARDAAKVGVAKELAKGVQRYYIAMQRYPWNQRNDSFSSAVRTPESMYYYDPKSAGSDMNWMWNLSDAEEVKEKSARNIVNSENYYVYKANGVSNIEIWVCFEPESLMYMQMAADACNNRNRTAPNRDRTFDPCQKTDGTVALPEEGVRNLLCISE